MLEADFLNKWEITAYIITLIFKGILIGLKSKERHVQAIAEKTSLMLIQKNLVIELSHLSRAMKEKREAIIKSRKQESKRSWRNYKRKASKLYRKYDFSIT